MAPIEITIHTELDVEVAGIYGCIHICHYMKLNTFEDDCQYNCWHDLTMAASSLKSSRLALGISREKMAMQYLLRHYLNATVIRHESYCLRNWNTMSLCFLMIDFNIDILPSIDIRCSKCYPLQFHYNLGPTRDQQTRYVPWPYLGIVRIFDFIIFRLVNIRRLGIRVKYSLIAMIHAITSFMQRVP